MIGCNMHNIFIRNRTLEIRNTVGSACMPVGIIGMMHVVGTSFCTQLACTRSGARQ